MGGMDLQKKTRISVKNVTQSYLEDLSNQINAASMAIHLAPSLTPNDSTLLKNLQAKVLDPCIITLEFLDVINGKVRPELFIEALRQEKLHDLADKVEKEYYDMLTSESDRSTAQSSVSRSSERSLPSLSDNLSLSTTSSLSNVFPSSYSSLPTLSAVDSRAATARVAHSDTSGSGADKENHLPSSVSLTSSLSAAAAVASRDNSVNNKQVFKRSQSDAATSTGTDFTIGSRPIHIHGPVQSVLIGDSNVISVDNSGRGCQDCETDGGLESIKYEIITEEDPDHMRSGGEEMRSGNAGDDETLVKRLSQSTAMNQPARVEGAPRGSQDTERVSQNGSQRGSQGGDPPGSLSSPVESPGALNQALPRDQGRSSRSDEVDNVTVEAWGTERSVAASLGVDLRPGGPACEGEGETKVWKIGREGGDDEDDTEIFKPHRNVDKDENTKLYKLERELSNTDACGTGAKVDEAAKTHLDQDDQKLTSSEIEAPEGAVDTAGHVCEGAGHVGEGTGLAGEGAGLVGKGVGLAGEGAGLVGEGAGLLGEVAGLVDEGAGLVGKVAGLVGEGAGLVGEGSGLVDEGAELVGEGSGLVDEGAGLVDEGAGLVGEVAGLVDEGAGLVGERSGLVDEGAGLVGEGAGLVGEGSGLVDEGAGLVGEGSGLAGAHEAGVKINYNSQDSGLSLSDSVTSNETRDSFSDDNVVEHSSREENESRSAENSAVLPSSLSATNNINTSSPLRHQFLKAVFSQIIDVVK